MINEIKKIFGLEKDFADAGYAEMENHRRTASELKTAVKLGGLIVLTGAMGSGKTVLARKLRKDLSEEGEVLVSVSLAADKERLNLDDVLLALFADLDAEKVYKPITREFTEKQLIGLIKRENKPVALFIDDAHACSPKMLGDLESLIDLVRKENGAFSLVLIGNFEFEKIDDKSKVIRLEGIRGKEKSYLQWLLSECSVEGVKPEDILTWEAIELIARHCHTPPLINRCAEKVLEEAYLIKRKPVEEGIVEDVLAKLVGRVV